MKNVVLLSGGMDSAVALALAKKDGQTIAVTFDYGQANRGELVAADALAKHYRVSRRLIKLNMSYANGACAGLGGSDITCTFVPARNLLFLSYAISVAEAEKASQVWFGANRDDQEYYPDTRPPFVAAMSLAAELGTQHGGVKVVAPFIGMTKWEVAELGRRTFVPLTWTTTCAKPNADGSPCGQCRGCKQREACGG
jgi:7-cyano-7-deazaguanine synthase